MKSPTTTTTLVRSATSQAFASDGTPFNPQDDLWFFRTLSSSVIFDFGRLRNVASEELIGSAKSAMRLLVETRNLRTVLAAFKQFRYLCMSAHQRRERTVCEIDAEDVAYWCARGNVAYLAQLRILTEPWRKLKLPGILSETHTFMAQIRVPPKNDKDVVRTWDPEAGAYRPAEDVALKAALDAAFNSGEVSLYDYAVARMLRGLGMRPAQLAAIKVCDLRRNGERVEVRIPLVKQRGIPERGAFMPWKPITQGLADILFLHVETNVLPRVAAGYDQDLAQLFPRKRGGEIASSIGVDQHQTQDMITKGFQKLFARLAVVSPITGRIMVVNPQRERHTVLTGLAMNGCNALEIAANAGHSSPESCQAYVDAGIDHFQRMERLVGEAFIPIADRFLGKVVREAKDLKAKKDPDAVLRDNDLTGVGSCEIGGCQAVEAGVAPVACYTCRKFRAWAEGPHEALLGALLARQSELIAEGHAEMAETSTATIVAITDLLEAIQQREAADG